MSAFPADLRPDSWATRVKYIKISSGPTMALAENGLEWGMLAHFTPQKLINVKGALLSLGLSDQKASRKKGFLVNSTE